VALLVSLSDYKTYAGISVTTYDTQLTALLTAASAMVRRWCGRDETNGFESAARTEKYDGTGVNSITLNERPVASIASVSWIDSSGTATAIDAEAYKFDVNGTLYLWNSRSGPGGAIGDYGMSAYTFDVRPNWGEEPRSIQVVYTAGYATIPADLQYVVKRIVDGMWADTASNPGMKSESTGAQSYTRATPAELQATYRDMLADFITGGA